jgi:hypothetical protein
MCGYVKNSVLNKTRLGDTAGEEERVNAGL